MSMKDGKHVLAVTAPLGIARAAQSTAICPPPTSPTVHLPCCVSNLRSDMTTERKDIVPASFPRSASGEGVLDSLAKALLFDDHGKGDAKEDRDMKRPVSQFVDAMLTDLYQITMAYGYWLSDRHDEDSVFDCFFRENPFSG